MLFDNHKYLLYNKIKNVMVNVMKKVVVVGGGAAGVFFAIHFKISNPKVEVEILEQNDRLLKKLLKTGNGKCNIMTTDVGRVFYNDFSLIENNYLRYDIDSKFEEIGILLKSDFSGRVYPYSESAKTVVNILLDNINKYGIKVRCNYEVINVKKENDVFIINNDIKCDYLVFSTGSKAQEKTNGYDILKTLGHKVVDIRPGLVPLYTVENTEPLKGIRWKCDVKAKGRLKTGEVQFRDKGLSGIVIMDYSNILNDGDEIVLDLTPEITAYNLKYLVSQRGIDTLLNVFPKMLKKEILKRAGNDEVKIQEVIKNFKYTISGRRGFDEAQICLGGIQTSNVNKMFESKKCENLYIVGEVLDVSGATGGYNLYFAWLSGYVACVDITYKLKSKINKKIDK